MPDYNSHSYAPSNASGVTSDEDHKDSSKTRSAKRQRVHFSCTECHRRKQKCNRETPCQHCIARKIPERCKTFQPGEDPNDLGTRVARLERTMTDSFEKIFEILREQRPSTNPSQHDLQSIASASDMKKLYANTPLPTYAVAGNEGEDADEVVPLSPGSPKHGVRDGSGHSAPMSMRVNQLITHSIEDHDHAPNPDILAEHDRSIESAAPLDAVMQEYGTIFNVSQVLLSLLPPREQCEILTSHFFDQVNFLRQPLSRKRFNEKFESFWASGPTLTPMNINIFSIIIIIVAIGAMTHRGPGQIADDPRMIRIATRRIFLGGRQSLLFSTMLGNEDMEQVLGYHLASRFLFLDRRISEAWTCVANAVKAAHSIGLHRDGTSLNLSRPDSEARRRIWSYIYFTDRILCMNLGRPTAIDDNVVDTALPIDEDESGEFADFMKPMTNVIPEGEHPRFLTYTRFRHQVASIMGRVISTYQNLKSPAHYSDVVAIDNSLLHLQSSLPDHLRSEITPQGVVHHICTKWDDVYGFVIAHRYMIQSEIMFVRMSLNRPYLTRHTHHAPGKKGGHHTQNSRYQYSRSACIEAAHQTLLLRRDFGEAVSLRRKETDSPPMWVYHLGTYNVLHAIVILGLYLLSNPHTENADILLSTLRSFHVLWQNKKKKGMFLLEDTKERDMIILQIFLDRIDAVRAGKRINASSNLSDATLTEKRAPRKGATHPLPSAREAPNQWNTGSRLKDEDTAGSLLDLNPGRPRRNSARQFANNVLSTDTPRKREAILDDKKAPWPYLPTQMPHHQATANGGFGTSSSPQGNQSNTSTGEATPPANGRGGGTGNSSSDENSEASVHQLFDSWLRYNAFESMELDGPLNQYQASLAGNAAPDSFHERNTGMLGMADNAQSLNNNSYGSTLGLVPSTVDTKPTSSPSMHSGVQWSTLPTPAWGPPDDRHSNNSTHDANAGRQFEKGSSLVGPAGTSGVRGPGPSGVDTGSVTDQQMSTSSFDPTFWASLLDKISTN